MTSTLGVLGFGALASVDAHGLVSAGDLAVGWLVGADDRWHVPAEEAATNQQRMASAPVFETTVRVPGGEVGQKTYAAAAAARAGIVMEIENRSPTPLTVALVVQIERSGPVELTAGVLRVDGIPAMIVSRPPGASAAGRGSVAIAMAGEAHRGPMEACAGPIELTLLFPVPHTTCLRVAFGEFCSDGDGGVPIDIRELPDVDAVARGWERQLDRGMQVELPAPVGDMVDAARSDVLLRSRQEPETFTALEDWGFDDEAALAWAALGWRARRRARRNPQPADPWAALRAADAVRDPAGFLSTLRAALVRETADGIELLPGFPPEWLGQSLTVDAVPFRSGTLSFAVRWHGARPALLWDAPPGVVLRVPTLDPAWSSNVPAGEALLAEPPASLLPMGTRERSAGEPVEAPGQFT